ncbi:MAG: energy transducer TonB [Kiritimatiellae bacterium]|nr:energy transducer TonB [Kiritimatiellia bacterium]
MKKLLLALVVVAAIAAGAFYLMHTEQVEDVINSMREQVEDGYITTEGVKTDPAETSEPEVSMPEEPLYVGDDVLAPVRVSTPSPQYTETAKKARIQGVVIVQTIIDKGGNVTDAKVLKGLPMGLDEKAIEAIKTWTFKPATLHGNPVSVYYNLTVNFRLQ